MPDKPLTQQQKIDALKGELKGLQVPLFADRNTMQEAYDYAMKVAEAMEGTNKIAVITAVHVLMNTMSKVTIEKLDDLDTKIITLT